MIVYIHDNTLDGILTAVFDAYSQHQHPDRLIGPGQSLPLFCDEVHKVITAENRAQRVWAGLEKRLTKDGLRMIAYSCLSELPELYNHLFQFIYKVFQLPEGAKSIERNFSDQDVLAVYDICRKVSHEALRMKQFVRFQKAKDGTYLGVVHPDHNVLPLVIDHFADRFRDQNWMLYDAKRKYGYYSDQQEVTRVTFENDEALPFDFKTGKLNDEVLSENDKLFQELWRTYFKAICIKERINPKKQLNDMPRRYWKYMTEKQ